MLNLIKNLILTLLITVTLQGCMAVVAGAAIGGVVVYDGRDWHQRNADQHIALEAQQKLNADQALRSTSRVAVSAYNGVVLLVGQTPSYALKQQAQQHLRYIPGIKRVYNEITVSGPISAISQSGDAWITTKVKTEMLANKNLKSSSIKVVTENGTVFLMGSVTRSQGRIASDVTRKVTGVQKVVTLFVYVRSGQGPSKQNTSSTRR